jgi:hypothetical protein
MEAEYRSLQQKNHETTDLLAAIQGSIGWRILTASGIYARACAAWQPSGTLAFELLCLCAAGSPTALPAPNIPETLESEQEQYWKWIAANEPDADVLRAQREAAASLAYRPHICILLTTGTGTSPNALRETIASVREQTTITGNCVCRLAMENMRRLARWWRTQCGRRPEIVIWIGQSGCPISVSPTVRLQR